MHVKASIPPRISYLAHALPLSNVGDLNNLGGKGERAEIASASV